MSAYYGYRRRRKWHSSSPSKKTVLTYQFGEIVHDVERTFLQLPSFELNALLIDYGEKYGKSAESYARHTYEKWKTGGTALSGSTAERLIELLPMYLSASERFELVKKLRTKYLRRQTVYLSVLPDRWQGAVKEAIQRIITQSHEFKLPDNLVHKATWLANGDVEAAQRLLTAAEEEEARLRAMYLDAEFKRIEVFFSQVKDTRSASHTISIPQGEIHVSLAVPKQSFWERMLNPVNGDKHMTDEKKETMEKSLVRPQHTGSLLDIKTTDLTPEEQHALRPRIIDEKLKLDVSQHQADQRFFNSARDIATTVRAVGELERSSKTDYDVKATFETASGHTDIHVKKNNNTVIIVVAVVIGVIIFLFLK